MIYHPLIKSDIFIILRGFLLLTAIILIGVGVAQHQLSNLTQKNEDPHFLSLNRDVNYRYSAYFLGSGTHFHYLFRLGEIGQKDGLLVLKAVGRELSVPVHFHFKIDAAKIKFQFSTIIEHFKQTASIAKNYLKENLSLIFHYFPVLK